MKKVIAIVVILCLWALCRTNASAGPLGVFGARKAGCSGAAAAPAACPAVTPAACPQAAPAAGCAGASRTKIIQRTRTVKAGC